MELIILAFVIVYGVYMLPDFIKYKRSNYKIASGNNFFKTMYNTGNYGEFLIFSTLEKLKGHHKLMTNLYIPKEDGTTTEIDLIMISQTGIYVLESKNYSGWIFGDENNKYWTQTLPNRQKNRFFNPIWQNTGHINALKSVGDLTGENLYKSYIIFSKRCTLKNVNVKSPNIKVIKRNELNRTITQDIEGSSNLLTIEEVNNVYMALEKYALADKTIKKAHIDNIEARVYSQEIKESNRKASNYTKN